MPEMVVVEKTAPECWVTLLECGGASGAPGLAVINARFDGLPDCDRTDAGASGRTVIYPGSLPRGAFQ